ncbi:MAG TPA: condensation domain-containing protein, partial [Trebonia sp.]|nr:condensation domain-containing protein [Trebonia sp.]
MSDTDNDRDLPVAENYQWELTAGQLGVWRHQQIHPESPIYNVGEYLEIHGDLNLEVFESALRQVVGEADAFHLRFHGEGESVLQRVAKTDDWTLHFIDFTAEQDPRVSAAAWMRADMRRKFDLEV